MDKEGSERVLLRMKRKNSSENEFDRRMDFTVNESSEYLSQINETFEKCRFEVCAYLQRSIDDFV